MYVVADFNFTMYTSKAQLDYSNELVSAAYIVIRLEMSEFPASNVINLNVNLSLYICLR